MIGDPKWFEIRKYGGWGIKPKTWQGWLYLGAITVPFIAFQLLPYWTVELRIAVTMIWLLFIAMDAMDIMFRMKKDERELMHEAIAERNVAWFMVAVMTLGLVYQLVSSSLIGNISFDPLLVIALAGGLVIKIFSYQYLKNK